MKAVTRERRDLMTKLGMVLTFVGAIGEGVLAGPPSGSGRQRTGDKAEAFMRAMKCVSVEPTISKGARTFTAEPIKGPFLRGLP
jgi:hypothetical protein